MTPSGKHVRRHGRLLEKTYDDDENTIKLIITSEDPSGKASDVDLTRSNQQSWATDVDLPLFLIYVYLYIINVKK